MSETTSVITKNGTKVTFTLSKLSMLWVLLGSMISIIVAVTLWYNSMNTFKQATNEFQNESKADREAIWRAIIEMNYNSNERFKQAHPNVDYNWRGYEEIRKQLLLN